MGAKTNLVANYRVRLLAAGFIETAGLGKVDFAIPRLRQHCPVSLDLRHGALETGGLSHVLETNPAVCLNQSETDGRIPESALGIPGTARRLTPRQIAEQVMHCRRYGGTTQRLSHFD